MIRPDEITTHDRVLAWLRLIEQELLLFSAVARSGLRITCINRALPPDLVDAVDDHLKADGWRLHRPPREYSGELLSPNQPLPGGGRFFEVVEDKPCKQCVFRHPSSPRDPPAFCRFCGKRE